MPVIGTEPMDSKATFLLHRTVIGFWSSTAAGAYLATRRSPCARTRLRRGVRRCRQVWIADCGSTTEQVALLGAARNSGAVLGEQLPTGVEHADCPRAASAADVLHWGVPVTAWPAARP